MSKKGRSLHMKRHPTLRKIPIGLLKSADERETDEHLVKLYQRYMTGLIKGAWTRVEIASIVPGIIRYERGTVVETIEYEQDRRYAHILATQIRQGARPALTLYPGFSKDHKDRFICSDDLPAYYAYRNLGIKKVPAMILGSPEMSKESAILTKYADDGAAKELQLKAKNPTHVMLSLSDCMDRLEFSTALEKLIEPIDGCLLAIKAFDLPGDPESKVQYHETLYSIAYRMKEGLLALRTLDQEGFFLQGRPIVRSLYELFLNFYIDWLAPHQMGPILQSFSEISRLPKSTDKKRLEELVREKFGGLVGLCETVSQKGRLSPVGESGHEKIYSRLSPIAHQDFGVTQQYVALLAAGDQIAPPREEVEFLIETLDIVVCATITRILDDVGAAKDAVEPEEDAA